MRVLGRFARFAHRPHTPGADVEPNPHAVHGEPLSLHIRTEITIRAALGEADVLAERLCLAANITLPGHGGSPFESETMVRRDEIVIERPCLRARYATAPHVILAKGRKIGVAFWTTPFRATILAHQRY